MALKKGSNISYSSSQYYIFKKKSEMSHWGRFSLLWKNKIKTEDWKPKVGEEITLVTEIWRELFILIFLGILVE